MSSLARMLAILDLFDEGASVWTADAIAERLGYSLPTGYRYVRQLGEAGLLRRDAGGTYMLGPRVIELDHRIRVGDPLLGAAQRVMRALADDSGCDVVLGTIYGERIITIHQEHGIESVSPSYGRGRRMPLYRGMLSKAVLATLPRGQLRRLYKANPDEAHASPFAAGFADLLAHVKAIRSAGYCVTHGELDPGLCGIGVPLSYPARRLTAALGFIISRQRFANLNENQLAGLLHTAGNAIIEALPPIQATQQKAPAAARKVPDKA